MPSPFLAHMDKPHLSLERQTTSPHVSHADYARTNLSSEVALFPLFHLLWVDCGQGSEVTSNGSMDASEDGLMETACAETEIHETGSEVLISSGRTAVAGDETGIEVKERAKVRW